MYRPGPVFTSWDLGQDWQVVFQNETGKTWGGVFQNEPKAVFQNETEGAAHFETDNNVEKHIEKNVEREGEREAENTPSPPKDFDEMIKRVNAEVATIEAEKEKNTPVPAAPSLAPTHVVTTVDGQKLPGALVATIEGLNLEQTTRETAAEALTRRISNPLADNAIDAGKLIEVWCAENSETVKWAYEAARRKLTPDDLSARIIDFCGCYANSVEPGKQVLFFGDPARMFKNGLTKWLQTQNKFDRDQAAKPNTGKFQQQDNAAAYVAPKAVRPVQTFYE